MEAIWITVTGVVGIVVVIVGPICAVQWARVRQAEADAQVKQDMLARGLSVEEIERLSTPASVRQAQIAADSKVREAQIAADLKRDMLAHGLSVEEVERLVTPKSAAVSRPREEANALASAIVQMIEGEGHLDEDAVAGLLALFLDKEATRVDRLGSAKPAKQMPQTPESPGDPGENAARELHSILAEPLAAAAQSRDCVLPSSRSGPRERAAALGVQQQESN